MGTSCLYAIALFQKYFVKWRNSRACNYSLSTQIKAGQINSETIHVIDFVPTILELTGATTRYTQWTTFIKMEGRSFLPLFKGKALPERTLGWEFNTRRALYKGDWAVQFQVPPYGTGEWELYNRKLDPSYRINLASKIQVRPKNLLKIGLSMLNV